MPSYVGSGTIVINGCTVYNMLKTTYSSSKKLLQCSTAIILKFEILFLLAWLIAC
jgi:hypothetical protein